MRALRGGLGALALALVCVSAGCSALDPLRSDPGWRADQARKLVELRIARSPFPEVRADAAAVEEKVLRLGVNPVSLAAHPPRAARLALDVRGLAVAASWTGPAALGAQVGDSPRVTPDLPLRSALEVELTGVSRPVGVCGPLDALDPTPCLAPSDLRPAAELARVDEAGVLHLAQAVAPALVDRWVSLARLSIPIRIGDGLEVAIDAPLRFSPPGTLVVSGDAPGAPGPDLRVTMTRVGARITIAVEGVGSAYRATIEAEDAAAARIVSRGARGAPGASGRMGFSGSSGSWGASASCPPFARAGEPGGPGEAGEAGGAGGPGGPGGRGGTVDVFVSAAPSLRAGTLDLARAMAASEGGAGGPGGRGGSGGAGGSGGSGGAGTTCWDDGGNTFSLPAGASGTSGPDGPAGPDGAAGPSGPAGLVRVHDDAVAPGEARR